MAKKMGLNPAQPGVETGPANGVDNQQFEISGKESQLLLEGAELALHLTINGNDEMRTGW